MTEVVAALIWDGDRFLACQRPAHKARGLLWEFAGGKVEPGETKKAALIRECREELGIGLAPGNIFMDVIHEYPDLTVHLTLFNAAIADGEPQKLEHNDLRWITVGEIDDYDFCPADEAILDAIRRRKAMEARVRAELFALQDTPYQAFTARLIPNIDPARIIGVRAPALRLFAKEFAKTPDAMDYTTLLPHRYLEENHLHASLIGNIRDYGTLIAALDEFLPYVDNWAVCDSMNPNLFKTHPASLPDDIRRWLGSDHLYTVRFGIGMLMSHYLGDYFRPEYAEWVAAVRSGEYYLNMMVAWYFATALAKQYEAVIPYLEENRLPRWTHNKTIQKAVESYRITDEQKAFLRTLRRKDGKA